MLTDLLWCGLLSSSSLSLSSSSSSLSPPPSSSSSSSLSSHPQMSDDRERKLTFAHKSDAHTCTQGEADVLVQEFRNIIKSHVANSIRPRCVKKTTSFGKGPRDLPNLKSSQERKKYWYFKFSIL